MGKRDGMAVVNIRYVNATAHKFGHESMVVCCTHRAPTTITHLRIERLHKLFDCCFGKLRSKLG